ncbi:MAG: DedA family protein [Actinomycetota bacterium]|nr:DedA family protein [Actinomycetota bacterium]MDP3630031.1 DedA family protein [Actinomycetota bacterium]
MTPQTGVPVIDWFLAALNDWGYLIVFVLAIFENLFIIGSFTPGETIVMAAGFVTIKGSLDPTLVTACAVAGALIGANISYTFGRRGGRAALLRWGGRFFDEERILAAEEYFERHGNKTVVISRFAALFKNFVPVIAGASKMRIWIFEIWMLVGATIYTLLMLVLGRVFAENFDKALRIARNITWFGMVLLVVMVAFLLWGRRKYTQRKVEVLASAAEADHDGEDGSEHGAAPGALSADAGAEAPDEEP